MADYRISRMALWAAYFRAFHAQHASPKVFDDPLAAPIVDGLLAETLARTHGLAKLLRAPASVRATLDPNVQQVLVALDPIGPAHLRPFSDDDAAFAWIMKVMVPSSLVLSRARYAEDLLEEAIRRGVRQYVILGAGLDTFAFRRPDVLRRVHVFEVDHPDTQGGKRRRLAQLRWEEPEGLHFVPVDLARESLAAALARVPYDRSAPTFVSWLGVTYYLESDALLATMRSIAEVAPAGSELVFDYFEDEAFVPEKRASRVNISNMEGERVGEPLKTGLDPATLAATLARVACAFARMSVPPRSTAGTSPGGATATTPSNGHISHVRSSRECTRRPKMRLAEIAILAGGVASVGVSIGHALFDMLLGWGDDLAQTRPGNRTVLYTIHVALYLLFLPFAVVSIAYPAELARPGGVGGTIALSYAAFWAWRLVWQVVYFRKLARESRRWRTVHPVLVILLAIMVVAYAGPAFMAWLGDA